MTEWLLIVTRPLVGAVIGYITNDIAIRMLFRPRTPKYIFGFHVPFTPGLIPKEKGRIARSIGEAISKNLMNREVIERTLLSDDMIAKINGSIDTFIDSQLSNTQTLEQFLASYLSQEVIYNLRNDVSADLSAHIESGLASSGLVESMAKTIVDHSMRKLSQGMPGMLGAGKIASLLVPKANRILAENINEMLRDNSRQMLDTLLDQQISNLLDRRMCDLFAGREQQIERFKKSAISVYRRLVSERLPAILDTLNIAGIVEQRINEMDVVETEKLILDVMKKELKAIVWFGAFLGFLMGCINLLF